MTSKNENLDQKELFPKITEIQRTASGTTEKNIYNKGKFLGKGGFARVYELQNESTGEIFAAKLIPKESFSKSRVRHKLMSEIKIHKSLCHTNIVQFHRFFETDDNVYILLELCTNQSLSDLLRRRKRLTELEAQCYLYQILTGINYLHTHRVIHRDIKLGNIFLSDKMEVKIGDLGLAAKLEYEGERKRTICGTPNYIAPEILDNRSGHSYECDIWSFGVLMYTLLIGKPPFETKDIKTTYRRIKMNLYTFPENIEISPQARSLISSILILEYSNRPTISQIQSHDFFKKNSFPKLLPLSTLAIPPSTAYLNQYTKPPGVFEKIMTRASSHENKNEKEEISPKVVTRHRSKETRQGTAQQNKIAPCLSSYSGTENDGPDIWVTKWLDYSSRYGIGYLLSNSVVGIIFNDNTRAVLSPNLDEFQYIYGGRLGESTNTYNLLNYPTELNKKVLLLQLFQKQLKGVHGSGVVVKLPFEHVKKWASTNHALIFRLTNKIIQVCFKDSTELILSSEKKMLTFVNKNKESCCISIAGAMESGNKQLIKRLKYSKEVLASMLKSEKNNE